MRRRRKTTTCWNCGAQLNEVYNYCPLCGQENTDNNVNLGTLIGDFFNNYLGVDSRFAYSIKPFLFKPGLLTREFIEGKRVRYMHPVRLYVFLSLFYFFVLSFTSPDSRSWVGGNSSQSNQDDTSFNMDLIDDSIDSTLIASIPDSTERTRVITSISGLDSLINIQTDSLSEDEDDDGSWGMTKDNWDKYQELKDDRSLSDQQILDSLNTEELSFMEMVITKQVIRINRSETQNVVGSIYQNLPIMMFFLLPIFALILKILYMRRKVLYIQHLIHSIHIHAFSYLIYGLALAPIMLIDDDKVLGPVFALIAIIVVTVYCFKSFRRVYEQSWFKTMVKFVLVGFMYSFAMFIGVIFEVAISLLFY